MSGRKQMQISTSDMQKNEGNSLVWLHWWVLSWFQEVWRYWATKYCNNILVRKNPKSSVFFFFILWILANPRQYSWVSLTLIFHRNKRFEVISMVDKCTDRIRLLLICFFYNNIDSFWRPIPFLWKSHARKRDLLFSTNQRLINHSVIQLWFLFRRIFLKMT